MINKEIMGLIGPISMQVSLKLWPMGIQWTWMGFVAQIIWAPGAFSKRRAFYDGPSSFVQQEMVQDHVVNKPIKAQTILEQAHQMASFNYENQTN